MYGALKLLINPYALTLFALGLALVVAWRRREASRWSLRAALFAWTGLYLLSIPLVAEIPAWALESQHASLASLPEEADSLVVLGGGVRPPSDLRPRPSLPDTGRERCLHAVELHRGRPELPIVLCGGQATRTSGVPSEAEVMRDFCLSLGVDADVLLVETASRDTFENLNNVRTLLAARGLGHPVLVTDARHMPRAVRVARKVGLPVTPSACDPRSDGLRGSWLFRLLPNAEALRLNHIVCSESIGFVWYWMRGRI